MKERDETITRILEFVPNLIDISFYAQGQAYHYDR